MSVRSPVVLVSLPNLPYLLGTFDTANFGSWWRSAPFPEAIAELKKGLHIYGRSHLAIARRVDGLWAVYRSKDYGINWERAWLASAGEVIYDIVLINFGWAIMNTSAGFYETQTAGASWTKVSNLPGASVVPAFCNIGGGDILLCTDGRYIWRSTDIARHWTLVCDQTTFWRQNGSGHYTGLSYPCIAGANGLAICGHGPYLSVSMDSGATWHGYYWWDNYWYGYPAGSFPPWNLVFGRPTSYLVKQILISSIDGGNPSDVTFLLSCDDTVPAPGESKLFSRIFQSRRSFVEPDIPIWIYRFQQYISPADGAQIDSYDLPITGADHNDRLVFSAQTRIEASGQPVPSLKYSLDGGTSWIDIDISAVRVGESDGTPGIGSTFLDDGFAKITWVNGRCDNSGHWDVVEGYRRQGLSYEMDFNLQQKTPETKAPKYNIDGILSEERSADQAIDAILKKGTTLTDRVDALCEGRQKKPYLLDRMLEGRMSRESPLDVILSVDTPCSYQIDVGRMWKQPLKYYHLDALMRTIVGRNYSCDVVLVKNNLNSTLSKMAGKIPQFLDLDVPVESQGAFNSSQETL